jgi:hypothetical protein
MARNTRNNNNDTNTTAAAMQAGMEAAEVKKTLTIITEKTKAGTLTSVNALEAPVVTADQIIVAGALWTSLCLNLLAGTADERITKAAPKRGGLFRLFGGKIDDPSIKALKVICAVPVEDRRAAWTVFIGKAKVVRTISLSGLAKAVKQYGNDDDGDKPMTFKEKLAAWCVANDGGRELPASLFDLLVEADVITTDEGAAKE